MGTMNMLTNFMKTHPEVQISNFHLLLSFRLICDVMLAGDKSKQTFPKQKLKKEIYRRKKSERWNNREDNIIQKQGYKV